MTILLLDYYPFGGNRLPLLFIFLSLLYSDYLWVDPPKTASYPIFAHACYAAPPYGEAETQASLIDTMKNTPFTDKHIALGAKMAEFAGYNMPISYSGINEEHHAVRNNAGLFDVSHMGEFILKGENALGLIQRVTTNDASKLTAGKAQYSCLPNEKGSIVDDLLVYCIEENKVYMIVVNASNIEKDWNWIQKFNDKKVEMHNISDDTCLLAVKGPNATRILQG